MKLLFVTPNLAGNSLGRTHCLWLLAEHLGHESRIAAVKGTTVWTPLADTDFARRCVTFSDGRSTVLDSDPLPGGLVELADRADLLVAVKPVVSGFGVGLRLARRTGTPLLLDIDDPDHEVRTSALPRYEQVARLVLRQAYRDQLKLPARIPGVPRAVSNPVLQARYGGVVIPHVRPPAEASSHVREDDRIVVRFVGSARPHKGVDVLRAAVARLAARGYRLEVTADPPADPQPWESWLGTTSMRRGAELVASSDIVAIPSVDDAWSRAQLPAKLIDAMMAGVAVVASDVGPIRWALGGTGLVAPPSDVTRLTAALAALADPQVRDRLGRQARKRAHRMFSVGAVAPHYQALLEYSRTRSVAG